MRTMDFKLSCMTDAMLSIFRVDLAFMMNHCTVSMFPSFLYVWFYLNSKFKDQSAQTLKSYFLKMGNIQ